MGLFKRKRLKYKRKRVKISLTLTKEQLKEIYSSEENFLDFVYTPIEYAAEHNIKITTEIKSKKH